MTTNLSAFTDLLGDVDEIASSQVSQPLSLPSSIQSYSEVKECPENMKPIRPAKGTGQYKDLRSIDEIDPKYRNIFTYPFFNLVQSRVLEDALYSDKSIVVCAPTGSGKTVIFEMAIVQLLMDIEDRCSRDDYKIIYIAPVKALCTERLTEWYSKFTKLGLLCIEVTGDTDVDFAQLQAYRIIITTPEKWDMLTRRWRDHRGLVEMIKLFLIDEVHILNDETRGPVLEAVVSRMKTIQASAQSAHRIEKLQKQYKHMNEKGVMDLDSVIDSDSSPRIRFVAVSATVSNPEDVAAWLGTDDKPAVYYKFGDECRPVKLRRVVEGYPCSDGTSIFKFDIILNYKLWPIIQKYHDGKPTLIFCNTRKSVHLTAETLSREITITFNPEQQAKLTALASTIKNKKLQSLVLVGVGCHHAGLLYEERFSIEQAFRNGDLPILITTTTLAMGVNLPAHLVIVKNTQQYVNGAYQEYSISTVLQMVGRAGRPQFDTEATAVIMTRQRDKARYQALAGGNEPLQSYLHKRLAENLNSETALGTVGDVAQCVEWLRSTFLYVRAAKDPKRYLGLTAAAPEHLILKKIEELCLIAMNGLGSAGLITMDEASCIESTAAGRLMSLYYLDVETMKHIMKIQGDESLERLVWVICESHELADMHLRIDERRSLNALNRNNTGPTIRYPMKGKITTRQMKLNCVIQAVLGCLPIPDPSLNQEAMKIMRIADRVCKCLVAYVTRTEPITQQLKYYTAILNSIILAKCVAAHLWENSPYVSKQLKGIGPTFSTLLATAGKNNFMLLEESHPRDLERIMNKGPPAGNVLRKQISLLPKYQLTAIPIDEKTVNVKLLLLNQALLSENMEHLTAGTLHKCYVIAGDSENHILMMRTFTDNDLINVYDATINYEITRKHNFEHKIFVHCISSSIVGIDVQCEYTFTNLLSTTHAIEPAAHNSAREDDANKPAKSSISMKNALKDRKRKICNDDIAQSKEKKKRDNVLAEKLKLLKDSFGRTSNHLRNDLQKVQEISKDVLNDLVKSDEHKNNSRIDKNDQITENINKTFDNFDFEDDHLDDFVNDDKIDSILNEIETEIKKTHVEQKTPVHINIQTRSKDNVNYTFNNVKNKATGNRTSKALKKKSNYQFMDLLEKNIDFSDEDVLPEKENGFSETVKFQIDKYIQNSHKSPNSPDLTIKQLTCNEHQGPINISNSINNDINVDKANANIDNIDFVKNNEIALINEFNMNKIIDEECRILKFNNQSQKLRKSFGCNLYNSNGDNYVSDNNNTHTTTIDTDLTTIEELPLVALGNTSTLDSSGFKDPVNNNQDILPVPTNKISLVHSVVQELPNVAKLTFMPTNKQTPLFPVNILSSSFTHQESQLVPSLYMPLPALQKSSSVGLHRECALYKNLNKLPTQSDQSLMLISDSQNVLTNLNQKKYASTNINIENSNIDKNIDYMKTNESDQISCNFSESKTNQELGDSLDLNIKDKDYEEKYSFSAEKIDIQTHVNDKQKIRVIRRLKVDLDVRKTVSNLVGTDKTNSVSQNQTLNTESNRKENKYCFGFNEQASKIEENKNVGLINIQRKVPTQMLVDDSFNKIQIKKSGVTEEKPQETFTSKDDDYDPETTVTKNKGISNILQKYSKIIGINKSDEGTSSTNQNSILQNTTKARPIKPKRPFKISDIQRLNLPLPSLYEGSMNANSVNKETPVTLNSDPQIINNANKLLTPTDNLNSLSEQIKAEQETCSNRYFDKYQQATPCHSPTAILDHVAEITEDEFKIDESMFNPKILLQSLRNEDEELIPPPPEFSDENIYHSYSPEVNYNINEILNDHSVMLTQDSNYDGLLELEENCEYHLNATKEIETWTLANDDENEHNLSQTTPLQLCNEVHKNLFQSRFQENVNLNNVNPRQGKLSAFKFCRKRKLKL